MLIRKYQLIYLYVKKKKRKKTPCFLKKVNVKALKNTFCM